MPSPALHLRAPLLWVLAPLMLGLTAAKHWPAPDGGVRPLLLLAGLAAALAALAAGSAGKLGRGAWMFLLPISVGLAGFALLHLREPNLHTRDRRPPREVTLTIKIDRPFPAAPSTRSLTGLGVITDAGPDDRELVGRRIYYSAIRRISVPPQRSGGYVVQGVLEPLPAGETGNSFNGYLANLGVHLRLTRAHLQRETTPPGWFEGWCARAEERLEAGLRQGLEDRPQTASLYLGMLLGAKAVLTAEQQNAFMRSGTFHIFSISGLHVGLIAAGIYQVCGLLRVPRRHAMLASLTVLWLYVQITGASAPALRAFLMIAFLGSTWIFRLPGNALAALAGAALLTLLLDPLQLFSTGFQMSYAVVAALVLMGRPLTERWLARWRPFALLPPQDWRWPHHGIAGLGRRFLEAFAACWVAFLASTPSGIGYFSAFSPGALPANLIIVPISTGVIYAGQLSMVAGLAGLTRLSALCNRAAALAIDAMDWLLRHGIQLPGMYFPAQFRAEWLAPVGMVLLTLTMIAGVSGGWKPRHGGYWPPVVVLALLLILGVKFG